MGVRGKADRQTVVRLEMVVRCMINAWRQTEDKGHRSMSQAVETGRGDLWFYG